MYGNSNRPSIIVMILMLRPWLMYAQHHRIINRYEQLVPPGTLVPNKEVCESHHRCRQEDSYIATVQPDYCFCDGLCSLYRDCCRRAEPFDGEPQNITELIQASSSSSEAIGKNTFHAVSSCPVIYNLENILQSCQHDPTIEDDWLIHTPVSEINYGIVFKNVVCAICHHGYDFNCVQFWMLKYKCYFCPANHSFIVQDEVKARDEMILTTVGPAYAGMNSTNNTVEEMLSMTQLYTNIPGP